jgi:hypothetical protein
MYTYFLQRKIIPANFAIFSVVRLHCPLVDPEGWFAGVTLPFEKSETKTKKKQKK